MWVVKSETRTLSCKETERPFFSKWNLLFYLGFGEPSLQPSRTGHRRIATLTLELCFTGHHLSCCTMGTGTGMPLELRVGLPVPGETPLLSSSFLCLWIPKVVILRQALKEP